VRAQQQMMASTLELLRPEIEERARGMAGWSRAQCAAEGQRCGDILAHGGERLLFGPSPRSPLRPDLRAPTVVTLTKEQVRDGVKARDFTRREMWDALATGLALGSLCPGGVTWLGAHFCTAPHRGCPAGGKE
jgi:hypothetical protein